MPDQHVVPLERVERSILILRGHQVILDSYLADRYGVSVKRYNGQVKRNIDRFPDDFAFTLTVEGHEAPRSQSIDWTSQRDAAEYPPSIERETGLGPATLGLGSRCSTN